MTGDTVETAVAALSRGDLVILPTETVYGLAADGRNADAVARIYQAKDRPRFNPLIAHLADQDAARALAQFDDRAEALATAFWPGPLTLVAPAQPDSGVCDLARAGLDTVAVRVPAHVATLAVLRAFGAPVVAPSANRSGRPSPTTFADAASETGAFAAAAIDGGSCAVGLESTVVSLMPSEPARLLRPGVVLRSDIEDVIGPLSEGGDEAHRSPGRLTRHYAPNAPVRLNADAPLDSEAFIGFGPMSDDGGQHLNLSVTGDLREAAANLFSYLRAADDKRPTAIAIGPIPEFGLGEAINDRLKRAAGYVG